MKFEELMNELYLPPTIDPEEKEEYFKLRIKATNALEKAGWTPQEAQQMWDNYMHKYSNNMHPLESTKEISSKLIEVAKRRKDNGKK
jgi:hypothetical protein